MAREGKMQLNGPLLGSSGGALPQAQAEPELQLV